MEIIVPSVAETQLTGFVGAAKRKVRSVAYEVRFQVQAGRIVALPYRNGLGCDWTPMTRKMAIAGAEFFGGM